MPAEWKVDVDPKANLDPVRIYESPEVGPYRLVAKVEREEDARLIVALYETHRQAARRVSR